MKKMLVSDYDQTFYINDEDIELNKKYIDKFISLNNIFVIATGRSYLDFNNKLNIYNFKYDYVILNHGATIIDKKGNILLNISMPNEILYDLKNELQLDESINWYCCSCIESRVNFEYSDLTKIYVKYNTKEQAMEMAKKINEKFGEFVIAYYVITNSVEIISNQTNKASAIYEVINKEQVNKKDVYSIGDGYSDIEMIKEFNGYCMENSVDELLDYCKENKVKSVSDLIQIII